MSFLAGLGSFAGGMATGLQQGQKMKSDREDAEWKKEERARVRADRKKADTLEADLKAVAVAGPRYKGTKFDDQGFMDEAQARQFATAPAAAGGPAAASQGGIPTPQAPADPLAPLPAQGMAQAQPTPRPQRVTVKDDVTGRWHNVTPDMVREPSEGDRIKEMVKVYQKHGKMNEGMQLLTNYYTTKTSENKFNREAATDALSRAFVNPQKYGQVVTGLLDQFDMDTDVSTQMATGTDGKQFPALMMNPRGTNAPPMFLDFNAQTGEVEYSAKPTPGMYQRQHMMLTGMVNGNLPEALAQMTATRAAVENMAINRNQDTRAGNQDRRAERMAPIQEEAARAGIRATNEGIVDSQDGRRVRGNQDRRAQGIYEHDYSVDFDPPASGRISSDYRDVEHNRRVGGVEGSAHTKRDKSGRSLGYDIKPKSGSDASRDDLKGLLAETQQRNPHLEAAIHQDSDGKGYHVHVEPKPGMPQRNRKQGNATRAAGTKAAQGLRQDAFKWVEENGGPNGEQLTPGTPEFTTAVRNREMQIVPFQPPEVVQAWEKANGGALLHNLPKPRTKASAQDVRAAAVRALARRGITPTHPKYREELTRTVRGMLPNVKLTG